MPQTLDISDRQLKALGDLVYRHCGIDLHEGKKALVQARMAKRLRALDCQNVDDYFKRLEEPSGAEFGELIDALSTNLTSFFRERGHFDYLSSDFLPAVLARKAAADRKTIRAWSAGCSSGEEAYSIAMTVLDAAGPAWDVKILATDISRAVLNRARRGVFPREAAAAIPPTLARKYLRTGREQVEAGPSLREAIRFNYLNLMTPWPFRGPFDFVFCRNVMIYFDKPTQQRLVDRFYGVLAPGGVLFTGHSESLTGIQHRFRYVQPTVYMK
jgi:chemotaxis protein methyltransferase CheR